MHRKMVISGAAAAAFLAGTCAWALSPPLPWGQSPDMVGWETFVQVVAPSGNANNDVEFETWASDEDIYTTNPQWPTVNAPKKLQHSLLGAAGLRHGQTTLTVPSPSDCNPPHGKAAAAAAKFPAGACIGEEVRRNWATYQYVVGRGLNTIAGLKAYYATGKKVDLPADAVEVKADWVAIDVLRKWLAANNINLSQQQVRQRYYVNQASDGTSYALVAFHFFTKQQKNWVWADFEHELNPGRCDLIGCHDNYGAVVPNVNSKAQPWQQYGTCAKSPKVKLMFANAGISPVWSHYCMKGTQINYTNPRLLGNSVIEAINADVPIANSSCIGCHYYASFDQNGQPNFPALGTSPVGPPDPNKIKGYRPNDFIWGIVAAK
ncbi:MAG TPA: hypothetical protein VFZ91_08175 [Allosphingosinicella sp.]